MQRRREQRYPVSEVVTLRAGCASGQRATLVDVSRSGYGLVSGSPLPVGMEISLTLRELAIAGSVRYCEPQDSGLFRVGVLIQEVAQA